MKKAIILFMLLCSITAWSQSKETLRKDYKSDKDFYFQETEDYIMITNLKSEYTYMYIYRNDYDPPINWIIDVSSGTYQECTDYLKVSEYTYYSTTKAWKKGNEDFVAYILWDWKQKRWFISVY